MFSFKLTCESLAKENRWDDLFSELSKKIKYCNLPPETEAELLNSVAVVEKNHQENVNPDDLWNLCKPIVEVIEAAIKF